MKTLYSFFCLALLASCDKQKIYVPQADVSLVTEVKDFSSIALLYVKTNDSVTVDVKENGIITQTNWLYEIDKRLPLHLVIPQVQRLQAKKLKKAKEKQMPSYFTYMDTIAQVVAFMPVTEVEYVLDNKSSLGIENQVVLKVDGNGIFYLNDKSIQINKLNELLAEQYPNEVVTLYLKFNKNTTFEHYLQAKLQLAKITLPNVRLATTEVIY